MEYFKCGEILDTLRVTHSSGLLSERRQEA